MLNPFDPMPTIKAILGLPIYQEVCDSRLLEALDDFEAPQCEVPSHHNDRKDQAHSGPAAFFLITRCHHHEGYLCAPIAGWLAAHGDLPCECGGRLRGPECTFIPIGGQS